MAAPDLTAYEDLTVEQQIGPDDTDAVQGWPLHFPDGSAPLVTASTKVISSDWSAFRDPNRTIYVDWVADVHHAETALATALSELQSANAVDAIAPDWLSEGIGRDLLVLPFVDRAYFRVLSRAQRLALSDTLTLPLVFEAADKLRHVEHAAVVRVEVENAGAPDTFADVGELWANSPHWRGLREAIELLLATEDWVEAIIAVNLVLDPLVGQFLRTEYLLPAAQNNNDRFTPLLVSSWTDDTARARSWTTALVDHLVNDPAHGAANETHIRRWITEWTQLADTASTGLSILPAEAPGGALDATAGRLNVVDHHTATVVSHWNFLRTTGVNP